MKRQVGLGLLLLMLSVGSALAQRGADRSSARLDSSRAQSESRYSKVGNETETETIVRRKVITVPVPDSTGPRVEGFAAGRTAKPKTKQVVREETVTVTKPAPLRVNPY